MSSNKTLIVHFQFWLFTLREKQLRCLVMQEASDAHSKTADSDTVSTYQVSSVQLVTYKKLEAFNKA